MIELTKHQHPILTYPILPVFTPHNVLSVGRTEHFLSTVGFNSSENAGCYICNSENAVTFYSSKTQKWGAMHFNGNMLGKILTHNVLVTMQDKGMVSKSHVQQTIFCESKCHVTNDVKWPKKVKVTNVLLKINCLMMLNIEHYKWLSIFGVILKYRIEYCKSCNFWSNEKILVKFSRL